MRPLQLLIGLFWASLTLAQVCVALGVVLGFAYMVSAYTDLAAQAAFQLGLASLVIAAPFALGRRWLRTGLSVAIAAAALSFSYVPAPVQQCTIEDKTMRLVFFNMWVRNTHTDETVEFLETVDADILVLTELSYQFRDKFGALKSQYPYHSQWLDGREWVGILSRYPMNDISDRFQSPTSTEHVKAGVLETEQGPMVVVGTHLTRPWPFNPPERQIIEAQALSDPLHTTPKPKMIVGDFNAVSWGSIVKMVTKPNGLRPLPSAGTWPTFLPRPLRIPIDQALIGQGFACASKSVGPTVGSDHKPIIVDFALEQ